MKVVHVDRCISRLEAYQSNFEAKLTPKIKKEKENLKFIVKRVKECSSLSELSEFATSLKVSDEFTNSLLTIGNSYLDIPSWYSRSNLSQISRLEAYSLFNTWFKHNKTELAYMLYRYSNSERLTADAKFRSNFENYLYSSFIRRIEFVSKIDTVTFMSIDFPLDISLNVRLGLLSNKVAEYFNEQGITAGMLRSMPDPTNKMFVFKGVKSLKCSHDELNLFLDQINSNLFVPTTKTVIIDKNTYWKASEYIIYRIKATDKKDSDMDDPYWGHAFASIRNIQNSHIEMRVSGMFLIGTPGIFSKNFLSFVKRDPMKYVVFLGSNNQRLVFFDLKKIKFMLSKLEGKFDSFKIMINEEFLINPNWMVFYRGDTLIGMLQDEKIIS